MGIDRGFLNGWVDDDGSNTVGTVWNKARINELLDAMDKTMVYCAMMRGVSSPINPGSWAAVPWEVAVNDPLGMHIGGGQIRVPYAGVYGVSATMIWEGRTGGSRYAAVHVNGVIYPSGYPTIDYPTTAATIYRTMFELIGLAANQSLTLQGYQDTASGLNVNAGTRMNVFRVG